jgi:Protein of unknown function (DUF2735)
MTNNRQGGSATIYQFPARGRFAVDRREAARTAPPRIVQTACGGAWYHEDAIAEDERAANN